jgi:hypothetical protein
VLNVHYPVKSRREAKLEWWYPMMRKSKFASESLHSLSNIEQVQLSTTGLDIPRGHGKSVHLDHRFARDAETKWTCGLVRVGILLELHSGH